MTPIQSIKLIDDIGLIANKSLGSDEEKLDHWLFDEWYFASNKLIETIKEQFKVDEHYLDTYEYLDFNTGI